MIVLGLGSGRTGTASLSYLISSQKSSLCFHELNPTGVVFDGNPQPIINTINEFQAIIDGGEKSHLSLDYSRPASVKKYEELKQRKEVNIIGDIAYYYLRYVKEIIATNNNVRFVCIKRDRTQTVKSWQQKSSLNRWASLALADRIKSIITRTPYLTSKNFWQKHDGTKWQLDPVWDKTFPNFEANNKKDAIGKYWDYYYKEAERLAQEYPTHFKIFNIEKMSNVEGQKEILQHIGVKEENMIVKDEFHMHKTKK